jgi:dipeptidyl aminopeptidase/acylaminoacyl peptidase
VEGGAAVPLADTVGSPGASWGEDDKILVGQSLKRGMVQVSSSGGTSSPVTELASGELAHVFPQVLPGGKAVLFVAYATPGGADNATVEAVTLADHHRKILVRGGTSARYLPSGHLVYVSKGSLFAIPFDLGRLETHGTPTPVLDDVDYERATGMAMALDFSREGTLVYRPGNSGDGALMTVQWLDATGRKEALQGPSGVVSPPRISPDGKRLVLSVTGGSQDVWVYDLQTNAMTRLTFGGLNQSPIWTPDGQYIVFADVGNGLSWTRADGAGQPQPLIRNKSIMIPWSFTPDGRRLAYMDVVSDRSQIWTVPVERQCSQLKSGAPEPFLKTQFSDARPVFSPDGHWLAYGSNESGRYEVYVRALPPQASGKTGKWQISNSGGGDPKWLHNGRELLYQTGDIGGESVNPEHTASVRQIMAVELHSAGDGLVVDKPRLWLDKLGGIEFDLTPDGKRLAVLTPVESAGAPKPGHEIAMLLNFFDELRRKVPVGK